MSGESHGPGNVRGECNAAKSSDGGGNREHLSSAQAAAAPCPESPAASGQNYYRDPDGNIIGPDVWIDGKPYEGTPLAESPAASVRGDTVTYVALAGNVIARARKVWRVYDGLRLDDNDGEFALWSKDDLIVALHELGKAIAEVDAHAR